jgi:hypothetical protein
MSVTNSHRLSRSKYSKYIHQYIIYYETMVQLLYLSGNHLPLVMIYENKFGHIEKLNTKIYWYDKYQYIEKKVSC